MNSIFAKILFWLLNAVVLFLYLFSIIAAMSDAQGAILFAFTFPVIVFLTWLNLFIVRKFLNRSKKFKILTWINSGFFVAVFLCGFVPFLNVIPQMTMMGIKQAFTAMTGKEPYRYFREKNDLHLLIMNELKQGQDLKINFSNVKPRYDWNRICIFTPYTDEKAADLLVGAETHLDMYSDLKSSDSLHVIAVFQDKSMSNYTKMPRSEMDFDLKFSECFDRNNAVFVRPDSKSLFKHQ